MQVIGNGLVEVELFHYYAEETIECLSSALNAEFSTKYLHNPYIRGKLVRRRRSRNVNVPTNIIINILKHERMKKNLFKFVERNDSNKQFENHLCASVLAQIFGGGNHANSVTKVDDKLQFCDPWSSCDAWNCAPDCRCQGNFA